MQIHRTAAALVIAMFALVACSQDRAAPEAIKPPAEAAAGTERTTERTADGPQVEATLITVRTVTLPGVREFSHQTVVAEGKVRMSDEVDRWRLFDLEQDTVTWVDDVAKTYRTHRGDALRREATATAESSLPHGLREAEWFRTGAQRNIAGVNAQQYVIKIGAYNRQLWVGSLPRVPGKFLSLAFASDMNKGPYRGLMRKAMPAMIALEGFIMFDRSDMQVGRDSLSIERTVTKVEQGRVSRAWLAIPSGYRDAESNPATRPSADRQSASSRQSGRDARGAGSQSSETTRTAP
ncbi:MAG TPA: hypothetical protein VNM92_07670 [Thermoanaerobaculia bacterium]|nr:hypothetical protein [Thermoanaerobaculia bacterium]